MIEIKKIKKGNKEYFYIVHSYREGKAVKKNQFYLGKSIPKDIEKKKKNLCRDFIRWNSEYTERIEFIFAH